MKYVREKDWVEALYNGLPASTVDRISRGEATMEVDWEESSFETRVNRRQVE